IATDLPERLVEKLVVPGAGANFFLENQGGRGPFALVAGGTRFCLFLTMVLGFIQAHAQGGDLFEYLFGIGHDAFLGFPSAAQPSSSVAAWGCNGCSPSIGIAKVRPLPNVSQPPNPGEIRAVGAKLSGQANRGMGPASEDDHGTAESWVGIHEKCSRTEEKD